MRKKIFLDFWALIFLSIAILVFYSCKKGDEKATDVKVTPMELSFEHSGGSNTIQIETDANWWISSNKSWCNLSTLSGIGTATVNVMVETNTLGAERIATLTIGNATYSVEKKLTVTQACATTQVRFRKEQAYTDVTKMAVRNMNTSFDFTEHDFGTASGTSQYYTIAVGSYRPLFYYLHPDDGWSWRYYPTDLPSYDFQANCKYTVVFNKNNNPWLSITNDGAY